jgi:hypothetical protein
MKKIGRDHAEWGFRSPVDGWHKVEMLEGVALYQKDGAPVLNDKGQKTWIFPAKINDDTDESNGINVNQFVPESDFGEQKMADILAGVGMFVKFEEKFPGDHSFFETPIMDTIKLKLPNHFCQMRTVTNKDGKSNVIEIASLKFQPEKKEVKKATKKESTAAPAATQSGDDW